MNGTDILQHGWLAAYVAAFVGGFLTSLTPCVYPLIPITVSLFGARDQEVGKGRALLLAAAYVNGMGVMYAALGIFVSLAGKGFGTHLANPWVTRPIALTFLVMAASMFGAFEMNLPPELADRLNKIGGKGFGGAFAMGLVGGIVAAPCTGPVLLSILTYLATTRSVVLGGTLLYTYALGMGVLFFFIAAFAQKLPKSGAWMEVVKSVFGVCMVVAALYFERSDFRGVLMRFGSADKRSLWEGLGMVAAGVAIGGLHLSFKYTGMVEKLRKALGVALLILGAWMSIVFVLTPRETHLVWGKGASAIDAAVTSGRPVMIDFGANWCLPCKELDLKVFSDPAVAAELERFSLVKVDLSDPDDALYDLQAKWKAKLLPTVVLMDAHGLEATRVHEVVPPAEFLKILQSIH